MRVFDDVVVNPFLDSLQHEGEETLVKALRMNSDGIKKTVHRLVENERARYQIERSRKTEVMDKEIVAKTSGCFINFQATNSALSKLQEHVT